jgi:poly(beta-D-mannuronate) lyase
MSIRKSLIIICALLEVTPLHVSAQTGSACLSYPPIMYLNQDPIYKDARNSIPDTAAERRNSGQSDVVTNFMNYIEKALDAPIGHGDSATIVCAYKAFGSWATAEALTEQPKHYNLGGTVKRDQILIGLDLLALKFRTLGYPISSTMVNWLHTLNDQSIDFYQHSSNRGNLYVWSGAAAALFALIDRDPKSLQYQDQVWWDAMSKIRDDGTIDGEMARGQRALIYHIYSFSATLVLRAAREALGYPKDATSERRVRLLADKIGKTLCDPGVMGITAKATQEIPGDWGYRIPVGFGQNLLSEDWARCGKLHGGLSDSGFGGDTRHSAAILKQLSGHPLHQQGFVLSP